MTRKQFGLVLLTAVICGLIGGMAVDLFRTPAARADTAPLLTVSELRLVDADGRTRGLLTLVRGKPRLILIDEAGEFRMEMGLGPSGEPSLRLKDGAGRLRMETASQADGSPALALIDGAGRRRTALKLSHDGSPRLLMADSEGRERLALWQEPGELGLALADADRHPRAHLAFKDQGESSLAFYGADGKGLWYAPRTDRPGRTD